MFKLRLIPGMYVKCISLEDGTRSSKGLWRRISFRNMSVVANNKMDLLKHLKNRIKVGGAITFAEYMKEALINPYHGYYMTKDVFGCKGDFTTSPEISQIFGELLGIWCFNSWQLMGKPKPLQLVELGPGRGTLMKDILRVFSKFEPENRQDISVHLVETSPVMSKMQMQTLCPSTASTSRDPQMGSDGFQCNWHQQLHQVARQFSIFVAHEFFDAMPLHKFHKQNGVWREVLVDISDDKDEDFRFVLAKNQTPATILFANELKNLTLNDAEFSPESGILMEQLCSRIVEDGGTALIADYGHQGEKGDTIRGFSNHQLAHPLSRPGEIDITADVNFSYLKKMAANHPVVTFGPINQRHFLTNLGIQLRLQKLLESCETQEVRSQLTSGCQMLLESMGERFQFLAVFPDVIKELLLRHPPAGFH